MCRSLPRRMRFFLRGTYPKHFSKASVNLGCTASQTHVCDGRRSGRETRKHIATSPVEDKEMKKSSFPRKLGRTKTRRISGVTTGISFSTQTLLISSLSSFSRSPFFASFFRSLLLLSSLFFRLFLRLRFYSMHASFLRRVDAGPFVRPRRRNRKTKSREARKRRREERTTPAGSAASQESDRRNRQTRNTALSHLSFGFLIFPLDRRVLRPNDLTRSAQPLI